MNKIKIITLMFLLSISLIGQSLRDYTKKGVDIVDIGKLGGYDEIVVPKEIIEYDSTLEFVDNAIFYDPREINKQTCQIDALGHESCPIEKKECEVDKEFTQGFSDKHEGWISCSQLHVDSYYDPLRDKCVLPSLVADVCKDYPGTLYDPARDLCYKDVTRSLPNDMPEDRYALWFSTGNTNTGNYDVTNTDGSNISNLIGLRDGWGSPFITSYYVGFNGGEPAGYHCGYPSSPASSLIIKGRTCNRLGNGPGEIPCSDIDLWGDTEPYSGAFTKSHLVGCYCKRYDTYTSSGDWETHNYYELPDAQGMCSYPSVYHTWDSDTCDWYSDDIRKHDFFCPSVNYTCDDNEVLSTVNETRYCTKEVTFSPHCQSGTFFSLRDANECLNDRLSYEYYTYSCPADLNVYDNPWEVVNPGGDCGEYNLVTDTNGDGIKDQCNSSTPDIHNCDRLTYNCSFNPDSICMLDEKDMDYNDFYKWSVENYRDLESASKWEVLNKNSVIQHINGAPTYFLSNYELQDGHITMKGTFKTDDAWDNDFFGFVFGFKDKGNHYLLSWSRWKNDTWRSNHDWSNSLESGEPFVEPIEDGETPLALVKLTDYYSGNWNRVDIPGRYDVLERYNNGGWSKEIEYQIKIDITRNDIKVWIGELGKEMHLDIDYHSDVAMDITGKLGFYNYSISKVTYKDFLIEWQDGKDVKKVFKRALVDPAVLKGDFKKSEFGSNKPYGCPDNKGRCAQSLSRVVGQGNKLCFTNYLGDNSCVTAYGECRFTGSIDSLSLQNKKILSFLNSPDEAISDFHTGISEDHSSPTGIALNFSDLPESHYTLKQVKDSAVAGDAVTIDFWMFWKDGQGMPIGFYIYDLWFSDYSGSFKFGFNTGEDDIYGINNVNFLKNSWHRITAVFTQGDILSNELFIDGEKQTLSEQHPDKFVHNNERADITRAIQLSGWTVNNNYSLDAKIAGLNVYDGRLSEDEVIRLYRNGASRGVSFLKIEKNGIVGFDIDDVKLGEINSSCELSGKVGYKAKEQLPVMFEDFEEGAVGWSDNSVTHLEGRMSGFLGRFGGSDGNESVYKIFDFGPLHAEQLVDIEFDVYEIDSWDGNSEWNQANESSPEYLRIFVNKVMKFNDLYEGVDGIGDISDGGIQISNLSDASNGGWGEASKNEEVHHYKFQAKLDRYGMIRIGFGSTLNQSLSDESYGIDNFKIGRVLSGQIVSAKTIDNRIEFWDGYSNTGGVGHIEVMKYVPQKDKIDGFSKEYKELDKLYKDGFTGFKTFDNNITYAVSLEPMDISTCQSYLEGTHYYLAERNVSDMVSLDAISALSVYRDGNFGDHCIIQRRGRMDNQSSQFSIKISLLEKVYTSYYCSPLSCVDHTCGTASCTDGFEGTIIKDKDKPIALSGDVCLEQKCDINKDYFMMCGNKNGCPEVSGVYQEESGRCVKATCDSQGTLNPETGKCEKTGCKNSIERGGRCFKKL